MQLDRRRRDVGRGPLGAAVRAGVVPEVADEGPLVVVGVAAAAAVLGVERVLELGQRLRGVLDPEVDDPLAAALLGVAAEVGDQRVVGVEDETRSGRPARRPSSPTRRRGSRSRRSGRAGRGRGCRARSGSGRAAPRPSAARPRRPRTAPRCRSCSSSAVAIPQVMFEPARLWTGERPSASSTAAIIPAVVVLPLVALTRVTPRPRPEPRREIASGARRSSTRPGSVVPPPRPLARLAAPIARAAARLAPKEPGARGAQLSPRPGAGARSR